MIEDRWWESLGDNTLTCEYLDAGLMLSLSDWWFRCALKKASTRHVFEVPLLIYYFDSA